MRRTRRSAGFTLIEVMMAIVLLLGIVTALWRSMALSFETKDHVSGVNDRYHEARMTMMRVTRELRMAFLRANVPDLFREEDPTMRTRMLGTDEEIYFATTAHLRMHADAPESDQCEVHYFLRSGDSQSKYRGKTLYRRESKRLDSKPERGGATWPVVEGVKEFKLEYWDDSKEIGDDAWQRDWDSDDNELLPRRVRITLVLEGPDGIGPPIRFVSQAAPKIRRPINPVSSQVGGTRDLTKRKIPAGGK
jgi:type II secretion system protein J